MRIRPTYFAAHIAASVAAAAAFVAFGAQAQSLPSYQRPADDSTFSVFVYDRLGATPSLQPKQTAAAPGVAQKKAEAVRERKEATPRPQATAPAAAPTAVR